MPRIDATAEGESSQKVKTASAESKRMTPIPRAMTSIEPHRFEIPVLHRSSSVRARNSPKASRISFAELIPDTLNPCRVCENSNESSRALGHDFVFWQD